MKYFTSRTLLVALCLLACLLFCSTECKDSDDKEILPQEEKCGELVSGEKMLNDPIGNIGDFYTYTEEGYAYFQFTVPAMNDVCPDKHIEVFFSVTGFDEFAGYSSLYAEVAYGILYTYQVPEWEIELNDDAVTLSYTANFGIKHVYTDEPGWILPVFKIGIKDQGSLELNVQFAFAAISNITIRWKYYKWKGNS